MKVDGRFVSYKSGKLNEELAAAQKAIHVLGGEAKEPIYFQLTGTEDERSFVCIEKVKATPKKYPRKAGTPAKERFSKEWYILKTEHRIFITSMMS